MTLPPEAFTPPPKVRSAVVHLEALPEPRFRPIRKVLSRVVAAAFNQRRKMLRAALKGQAPDIEDRLRAAGIEPTRGPRTCRWRRSARWRGNSPPIRPGPLMSRLVWIITHADVVIDPAVPVPDWGLNPRGAARHAALAETWTRVRPPPTRSGPAPSARRARARRRLPRPLA
jgi:hypothetical protein